jgi:hypothetical protein
MALFMDIAPCSLVEVDRRFRGAYCFHHQSLTYRPEDGGSGTSETLSFDSFILPSFNRVCIYTS